MFKDVSKLISNLEINLSQKEDVIIMSRNLANSSKLEKFPNDTICDVASIIKAERSNSEFAFVNFRHLVIDSSLGFDQVIFPEKLASLKLNNVILFDVKDDFLSLPDKYTDHYTLIRERIDKIFQQAPMGTDFEMFFELMKLSPKIRFLKSELIGSLFDQLNYIISYESLYLNPVHRGWLHIAANAIFFSHCQEKLNMNLLNPDLVSVALGKLSEKDCFYEKERLEAIDCLLSYPFAPELLHRNMDFMTLISVTESIFKLQRREMVFFLNKIEQSIIIDPTIMMENGILGIVRLLVAASTHLKIERIKEFRGFFKGSFDDFMRYIDSNWDFLNDLNISKFFTGCYFSPNQFKNDVLLLHDLKVALKEDDGEEELESMMEKVQTFLRPDPSILVAMDYVVALAGAIDNEKEDWKMKKCSLVVRLINHCMSGVKVSGTERVLTIGKHLSSNHLFRLLHMYLMAEHPDPETLGKLLVETQNDPECFIIVQTLLRSNFEILKNFLDLISCEISRKLLNLQLYYFEFPESYRETNDGIHYQINLVLPPFIVDPLLDKQHHQYFIEFFAQHYLGISADVSFSATHNQDIIWSDYKELLQEIISEYVTSTTNERWKILENTSIMILTAPLMHKEGPNSMAKNKIFFNEHPATMIENAVLISVDLAEMLGLEKFGMFPDRFYRFKNNLNIVFTDNHGVVKNSMITCLAIDTMLGEDLRTATSEKIFCLEYSKSFEHLYQFEAMCAQISDQAVIITYSIEHIPLPRKVEQDIISAVNSLNSTEVNRLVNALHNLHISLSMLPKHYIKVVFGNVTSELINQSNPMNFERSKVGPVIVEILFSFHHFDKKIQYDYELMGEIFCYCANNQSFVEPAFLLKHMVKYMDLKNAFINLNEDIKRNTILRGILLYVIKKDRRSLSILSDYMDAYVESIALSISKQSYDVVDFEAFSEGVNARILCRPVPQNSSLPFLRGYERGKDVSFDIGFIVDFLKTATSLTTVRRNLGRMGYFAGFWFRFLRILKNSWPFLLTVDMIPKLWNLHFGPNNVYHGIPFTSCSMMPYFIQLNGETVDHFPSNLDDILKATDSFIFIETLELYIQLTGMYVCQSIELWMMKEQFLLKILEKFQRMTGKSEFLLAFDLACAHLPRLFGIFIRSKRFKEVWSADTDLECLITALKYLLPAPKITMEVTNWLITGHICSLDFPCTAQMICSNRYRENMMLRIISNYWSMIIDGKETIKKYLDKIVWKLSSIQTEPASGLAYQYDIQCFLLFSMNIPLDASYVDTKNVEVIEPAEYASTCNVLVERFAKLNRWYMGDNRTIKIEVVLESR